MNKCNPHLSKKNVAWHLGIYILSIETTTKIPSHFYFLEYACCLLLGIWWIKSEVTNNFWGEGTKKFDIFRLCRWFENDFGEWGWVEEESQREWVIILLAAPLFFHCLVTILMHDFLPPFVFCSKLPSDHQTTLSSMGLFLLLSILVQVDATIVV